MKNIHPTYFLYWNNALFEAKKTTFFDTKRSLEMLQCRQKKASVLATGEACYDYGLTQLDHATSNV